MLHSYIPGSGEIHQISPSISFLHPICNLSNQMHQVITPYLLQFMPNWQVCFTDAFFAKKKKAIMIKRQVFFLHGKTVNGMKKNVNIDSDKDIDHRFKFSQSCDFIMYLHFPCRFLSWVRVSNIYLNNGPKNKWFVHYSPFYHHDYIYIYIHTHLGKSDSKEDIFDFAHGLKDFRPWSHHFGPMARQYIVAKACDRNKTKQQKQT